MFAYVTHGLAFCRYNNWDQSLSMLRLVRLGKLYQVISNRSSTKYILAELADLLKKVSGGGNVNSFCFI